MEVRLDFGRAYLSAQDANLGASEATSVSPDASGANPIHKTEFDKGGRTVKSIDALDNATTYTYDAANRRLTVTDALGANANYTTYTYDPVGNVLHVDETERPDNSTSTETFRTSYMYDELNRQFRTKQRGKDQGSNTYNHDIETFTWRDSTGYVCYTEDGESRWTESIRDDLGRTLRVSRYDNDYARWILLQMPRSTIRAYPFSIRAIRGPLLFDCQRAAGVPSHAGNLGT